MRSMKYQKSEFMQWLDNQLERDPEFRKRVDVALSEMRIQQDLAALRVARGISQTELAKRIGVSQPAIARLESGQVKNLTIKTLARYAAVLGGQVRIEIVKQPRPRRAVPLRVDRAKA